MADKEPVARNGQWQVKRAWIKRDSLFGLRLGDLRALVEQADGIPDSADVTFEGLTRTSRDGEYWAKEVMVKHEERQP